MSTRIGARRAEEGAWVGAVLSAADAVRDNPCGEHRAYVDKVVIRPVAVFDLDGTLRYSKSGKTFIEGPEDVAVYDDVVPKLIDLRRRSYVLCFASNQGGVAFGFKTMEQVSEEVEAMLALLVDGEGEALMDMGTYCPFHEDGTVFPFNVKSLMRKPEIGMIAAFEKSMVESGIIPDWRRSIFVGDRPEDRICANRAELKFVPSWEFFGRSSKPGDISASGEAVG